LLIANNCWVCSALEKFICLSNLDSRLAEFAQLQSVLFKKLQVKAPPSAGPSHLHTSVPVLTVHDHHMQSNDDGVNGDTIWALIRLFLQHVLANCCRYAASKGMLMSCLHLSSSASTASKSIGSSIRDDQSIAKVHLVRKQLCYH
jgi:hypothetical protein